MGWARGNVRWNEPEAFQLGWGLGMGEGLGGLRGQWIEPQAFEFGMPHR